MRRVPKGPFALSSRPAPSESYPDYELNSVPTANFWSHSVPSSFARTLRIQWRQTSLRYVIVPVDAHADQPTALRRALGKSRCKPARIPDTSGPDWTDRWPNRCCITKAHRGAYATRNRCTNPPCLPAQPHPPLLWMYPTALSMLGILDARAQRLAGELTRPSGADIKTHVNVTRPTVAGRHLDQLRATP